MKKKWIHRGFLNTLEHFLTRFSDAFVSLILIWVLAPEVFGQLALAQAILTPFLFFFISPETIIYRDFSQWKEKGPFYVSHQLNVFRKFSWLKLFCAFLLSFFLAFLMKSFSPAYAEIPYLELLFSFFWGVTLFIAPHVLGPDREFLRLELKFVEINYLTLIQKLFIVMSALCAAFIFSGSVSVLFFLAFLSFLISFYLHYRISKNILSHQIKNSTDHEQSFQYEPKPDFLSVVFQSLFSFSLWNHFIGVIHGWVQTMSLMLIGFTSISARDIGLYSTVLKLGNFSLLIPTALGQLFSIWIGRRVANHAHLTHEKRKVLEYSFYIMGFGCAQMIILYLLCPYIFQFFSQSRWSESEIQSMLAWVWWILLGNIFIGPVFLTSTWVNLRSKNKYLFFKAYIPFSVVSLFLTAFFVMSEDLLFISKGHVMVMFLYLVILNAYFLMVSKK